MLAHPLPLTSIQELSMSIYNPVLPYVYLIKHPDGSFYFGYRKANQVPAEQDFGSIYKTSSKYLSHPFEEYSRTILAEFFNADDAYDFEQLCIFENWSDPLLINKVCHHGKKRFRFTSVLSAESRAKISAANLGKKRSAETRAKISAAKIGARHRNQ